MKSIADGGRLYSVKKRKRTREKKRKNLALAVEMIAVGDLELIFPQDLKMWAKSAGRKFLEAQDKIKALSSNGVPASAYWDRDQNVVILSEDGIIKEQFK
jgi:hypothetical protein